MDIVTFRTQSLYLSSLQNMKMPKNKHLNLQQFQLGNICVILQLGLPETIDDYRKLCFLLTFLSSITNVWVIWHLASWGDLGTWEF